MIYLPKEIHDFYLIFYYMCSKYPCLNMGTDKKWRCYSPVFMALHAWMALMPLLRCEGPCNSFLVICATIWREKSHLQSHKLYTKGGRGIKEYRSKVATMWLTFLQVDLWSDWQGQNGVKFDFNCVTNGFYLFLKTTFAEDYLAHIHTVTLQRLFSQKVCNIPFLTDH